MVKGLIEENVIRELVDNPKIWCKILQFFTLFGIFRNLVQPEKSSQSSNCLLLLLRIGKYRCTPLNDV